MSQLGALRGLPTRRSIVGTRKPTKAQPSGEAAMELAVKWFPDGLPTIYIADARRDGRGGLRATRVREPSSPEQCAKAEH